MAARPIYLSDARPSASVQLVEAAIVALEGPLAVRGFQYSSWADASLARRQEAVARVREAERIARLAMPCAWCGVPIRGDEAAIELGGRRLHDTPCCAEFDAFVSGDSHTGRAD